MIGHVKIVNSLYNFFLNASNSFIYFSIWAQTCRRGSVPFFFPKVK